jgi:hypothetical protein
VVVLYPLDRFVAFGSHRQQHAKQLV